MSGSGLRFTDEQLKKILENGNCKVHEPRIVRGIYSIRDEHNQVGNEKRGQKPKPEKAPAKPKPARKASPIEESMWEQIQASDLPTLVRQHQYIPSRNFKADFAWVDMKLALEVDGAVHRIKGTFDKSFERGMVLLIAGWTVLHVGGRQVRDGTAMKWLAKLYAARTI